MPELDERIRRLVDAVPPLTLEEVTSPAYTQVPARRSRPYRLAAPAMAAAAVLIGAVVWVTVRHAHHPSSSSVIAPAPTPGRFGQLLAQIRGSDTATDDNFGYSVSLSGDEAIVGAPAHAGGRAYIFTRAGSRWHQAAELEGTNSVVGDQFGFSVWISGDTAVVGAPGRVGGGRAYVFTGESGRWREMQQITGSDTRANDQFGSSLAISGATLVVTAPGRNSGTGEAYVFTSGSRGWNQTAELGGPGTTGPGFPRGVGDAFGTAVDASGDTIVVGAANHGTANSTAYVFSKTTTGWRPVDEFTTDELSKFFAVSGNTLFVTLSGVHQPVGQIAVLTHTPAGWRQVGRLPVANSSPPVDFYPTSLSLDGSTAVICNNGAAADVFGKSISGWKMRGAIPGAGNAGFCSSVAASGQEALIGGTGTAYLYQT
jgi:hypothetical protein